MLSWVLTILVLEVFGRLCPLLLFQDITSFPRIRPQGTTRSLTAHPVATEGTILTLVKHMDRELETVIRNIRVLSASKYVCKFNLMVRIY